MNTRSRLVAVMMIAGLSACTAGGGASLSGVGPTLPSSPSQVLVPTSFVVAPPQTTPNAAKRAAQYLGSGAASLRITLLTVNGNAPPAGLTTSATSAISPATCPCTVTGPLVPPGSDSMSFTAYDGTGASGNAIATVTATFAVAAGTTTGGSIAVTLLGIPKTIVLTGIPAATAGTAFTTPAPLNLAALDADGNTITGTYANAVTVSTSDTSGALGSRLSVDGGTSSTSVSVVRSSNVVSLAYGGLATRPSTITASALGATSGTATFAPALNAIVYAGPLLSGSPALDLYTALGGGTGSTATFTASETGWTNAPYDEPLAASTTGCGSIGSISPASGTSFTFTAAAQPSTGTCTITITDGAGQSMAVPASFTTASIIIN